ncbi:MAG: NACHT domain-containing protein [Mycobacterium sp.]
MAEVVKYAQARYDENEQSRQIRRQVSDAVTAWAGSEKLAKDDVDLGLALAAETVARFGLGTDMLAGLGFDPLLAAEAVAAAARAEDTRWGTEDHHTVAIRAIGVTYEALTAQLKARDDTAISMFLALRGSIDDRATHIEDSLMSVSVSLGDLADALAGVGTLADVISYLRTRIVNWDVPVWNHQWKVSDVERLLKVRDKKTGQLLVPDETLTGERMSVVLGGPGAGKTWFSRRHARQTAQMSLSRLEDGAGLDDVELPLLTTWEQWAKTAGPTTQSLVASSFASGHGHNDVGGGDTTGRLERTFLRPEARVLLIVDSLDEAADLAAQAPRLQELRNLPARWRVVVTSRPAAWGAAYHGGTGGVTPRVVELDDLSYPDDVESFIRGWFAEAGNPGRGEALVREIHDRPEVTRAAVVPLVLTFYCLLAEDPQTVGAPLPPARRELYRRLVRRLLRGAWIANRPGPDAAPDWDYCEELLRGWAWAAVCGRINAAGLGVWEDSFTQPTTVRQPERRAIDHIAPKLAEDDEGNLTRRFVHRTFLEHFVAEHIATMETNAAAELLLPHLWFDPDWQIAAPAAIIAHNQQQKGALLQILLSRALQPAADPARQAARREFERLLLSLAQESEPGDWVQEHQDLLHRCRVDNTTRSPGLVARSAHWAHSNPSARTAVLEALAANYNARDLGDLVEVLQPLGATEGERAQARTAVLRALAANDNAWAFLGLVEVLLSLAPTATERAQARTVVLQAVASPDNPEQLHDLLIKVLLSLAPTESEREQARTAVLQAVASLDEPGNLSVLVEVLLSLAPTEGEREQARTAVLEALASPDEPGNLGVLVKVLLSLAPTEGERAQAHTAVVEALAVTDNPWHVRALADVLLSLTPTEDERAQARTAVVEALAATDNQWEGRFLADVLLSLVSTEDERAQARTAVLPALSTSGNPWQVRDLTEVLLSLAPTEDERAQARTAVLPALSTSANPWQVRDLAELLLSLAPTEDERAKARAPVLQALSATPEPLQGRALTDVLLSFVSTENERAQAREAVLQALSAPDNPWHVCALAEVLLSLAPTEAERTQARAPVLQALAATHVPWQASSLVEVLLSLRPTEGERARARTSVLQAFAAAVDPNELDVLGQVLPALAPTEGERAQARTSVLQALAAAATATDADVTYSLIVVLRSISSPESWIAWLIDNE